MPAEGLCIRLAQTGRATTSIPLSDIADGADTLHSFRKAGPVYVPTTGFVELVYAGDVAVSFEVGAIRKFMLGGYLTATFVIGDALSEVVYPEIQDEGIQVEQAASIINFTGAGVTATSVGPGEVEVEIPGGAGGDVVGPASSTDEALARFDGITGKPLQDSSVTVSNAGDMTFPAGATLAIDEIEPATAGEGVVVSDIRNYGKRATNPVAPAPTDGDTYYNTVLRMPMVYDGLRSKWLSMDSAQFVFGRNGSVPEATYYRTVDGRVMSGALGWYAIRSGTVVALGYSRTNAVASTFDVRASGSSVATVASSATAGRDITLSADFTFGDILSVANPPGSGTTDNVVGWVMIRWRV